MAKKTVKKVVDAVKKAVVKQVAFADLTKKQRMESRKGFAK